MVGDGLADDHPRRGNSQTDTRSLGSRGKASFGNGQYAMPIDILFDFAAIHLIGDKAADVALRVDFAFSDQGETWTRSVRRGVLNAGGPRRSTAAACGWHDAYRMHQPSRGGREQGARCDGLSVDLRSRHADNLSALLGPIGQRHSVEFIN